VSNPYVGEIRMFGGNFAPAGWALCQGQLMAISENDVLFQLIGTTYGGDGQSTFALPNLQSRIPVHQGPGYVIGDAAGSETVTLTAAQMPVHSHLPQGSSSPGTSTSPSGNVWAAWSDAQYTQTAPAAAMSAAAMEQSGGSQPHENMPPFLAVNFIISLFGIFPSQT
jgi:microcystin-dependent protein